MQKTDNFYCKICNKKIPTQKTNNIIQRCIHCNYCAEDLTKNITQNFTGNIGEKIEAYSRYNTKEDPTWTFLKELTHTQVPDYEIFRTKAIIQSERYKKQLNDTKNPSIPNMLICHSMILEEKDHHLKAAHTLANAALACDKEETKTADACRKRAAELIEKAKEYEPTERTQHTALIQSDLYRRAGCFEDAARTCHTAIILEEEPKHLLETEMSLIEQQDTETYPQVEALYRIDPQHK